MKKVFTSKELLMIDEMLNKYGSEKEPTVTAFELGLLTKLYEDYQQLVRRIDKTEADNDRYIDTIKNMKENFTQHLNALEAENEELKKQIEDYKYWITVKTEDMCKLKDKVSELHTIKKSFEVLRALYLGDYEDEPF